ncbi:L,D-transpeptidase [Paenibacillus silvisoli]|uniref:L,D-transpeptidase n=1 Tax=Paenibacillus silvisoli TaxID=3110539 RepID=UPI002803E34B|nr:L,D-transpeptidase [Paenibacillus silvisoli]
MEQQDSSMAYLKRYVQNHPNNRMAWYLLGNQYRLEGKEGKANYCFLQSGSIYEAYERKQHELAGEPKVIIDKWNRKRRTRGLVLRTAVSAALLMVCTMAAPAGLPNGIDERSKPSAERDTMAPAATTPERALDVVFVRSAGSGTLGKALGALMTGGGNKAKRGLAVMLEQQGKWRIWPGATRILADVERGGSERLASVVRLLDGQACDCQPADAASANKLYAAWSSEQEMRWTLISAITHYKTRKHAWPEALKDLTGPYPNNTLSGTSDAMRKLFPELLTTMKARVSGGAAGGKGSSQAGSSANGTQSAANGTEQSQTAAAGSSDTNLPDEPLSIIVDTNSHRLAVVSGDVIVRSYTVGLGGNKTPKGQFYISEKVKNPNGRDDGEFGSRGMTLSDTLYAIHGTDDPDSIGKDESHGCVRMNRKDVEELYDLVPLGTRVDIKSGVLPALRPPAAKRFRLKPVQDETNTAVVYRWLS